jgi:hypothetical protein
VDNLEAAILLLGFCNCCFDSVWAIVHRYTVRALIVRLHALQVSYRTQLETHQRYLSEAGEMDLTVESLLLRHILAAGQDTPT